MDGPVPPGRCSIIAVQAVSASCGNDHRAQRQGNVHGTVEANMPDAATVWASASCFQLVDDLHGLHLATGYTLSINCR